MIVGISGRKQAGKNTTANILHGIVLKREGFIEDWNIDASGQLHILDEGGWGIFDVTRQDPTFVSWADQNMWPFVKLYSFADELKHICTQLFNIPFECVYGTDEQKNQVQKHLLWENISKNKTGAMTAREFMQHFGTDVCRKVYEPIWVNACINRIQQEQSGLAIIADVRFPNEAKAIEQAGGKVVRLTRIVHEDNHSSEVALDDYPFTDVIDNSTEHVDSLMVKVKEFYRNLKEPHASYIR